MAQMKSFDRHEVGRELTAEQRSMFFALGSEIQSARTMNLGYLADADRCHETALIALESIEWASVEAGRAVVSVMRRWRF